MAKMTEEQLLAVNKENTNIIVSAGAGSGKTFVLSERVIRKLLDGVKINEILILTFTNKAAQEMKDRIRDKISKREELNKQLLYLDSSYISTFDAFSLAIVKKYCYLLNMGKDISVGDSTLISLELNRILDNIFERKYGEDDEKFLNMMDLFSMKNESTIKESILKINSSLDLKFNKVEYLNNYIEYFYSSDLIEENINKYLNNIFCEVKELEVRMNALNNIVEQKNYVDYLSLFNCKSYEEIRHNINTKKGNFVSSDEVKPIIEGIKKIITKIKELTRFETLEEVKNTYYETRDYAEVIIKILLELDKEICAFKRSTNTFDFSDIALMAIDIVKNNSEVKEELTNSFKEIMIDEYQDTSDLQEEFISLIANNNVYVVGDIKQSIYRFRNANPYLFKEKYDRADTHDDIFRIDLTNNFRSRFEVVDNINSIFSKMMTDKVGGAKYLEDHIMISGNKDYLTVEKQDNNMEILNYEYNKDIILSKSEIEIFAIAKDIKEKIANNYQVYDREIADNRSVNYNDFAILLDQSKNFDLIKKIFLYFNIPVLKYSKNNVVKSVEMLLIKNIINLLLKRKKNVFDLEFKYSFLSVGRSYLFEYKDNELFNMISNNQYSSSLLEKVDEIVRNLDSMSLNEIINLIIEKFSFYEKNILVGDVKRRMGDISAIINFTQNISNKSHTIEDLAQFIEELISRDFKIEEKDVADNFQGVKLMTIHSSKGLEFPICYFMDLDNGFNFMELNSRFLFSNDYGIITPYFNDGIGQTFIKELYKNKYYEEEISEKIRLFYVALTRAREKIIIVTSLPVKEIDNILDSRSFLDMLNFVKNEITPFVKDIKLEELNLTKDYDLVNKGNFKLMINNTEDRVTISEFDLLNEKIEKNKISKSINSLIDKNTKDNINLGIKVHEILEYLDFRNPSFEEEDEHISKKILKFLSSINIESVKNIYKEYEFKVLNNNVESHGVIDLILEYDEFIWIIDYKLKNIDDENYINQVKTYKDYIEKKSNKKVEVFLYSIIDEKLSKINL